MAVDNREKLIKILGANKNLLNGADVSATQLLRLADALLNSGVTVQDDAEKNEPLKGATKFDQLCHSVFSANGNGTNYLSRKTGVKCGCCGYGLEAYYCDERLYLVECHHCKTKALVIAGNPAEAAYKTFGHAVYPVEEMDEGEAVFFSHVPIDEGPYYVGSVIDTNFPEDDVVCGMYLPCPGTDGKEFVK